MDKRSAPNESFPRGWDGHYRAALRRRAAAMSPSERLIWLQQTLAELAMLQGKARRSSRKK